MLRKHPQSTIQELFRPDSTNDKQNIKDVTIIFIGCGESGRHYLYQEPRQHKKKQCILPGCHMFTFGQTFF